MNTAVLSGRTRRVNWSADRGIAPGMFFRHKKPQMDIAMPPAPARACRARRLLQAALVGGLLLAQAFSLDAATREAEWKKVDDAIRKGLPKTAIEALEPIIAAALKDRAYGEAAKAIARKIVLEGNIQGNKPEEKIVRLEAAIASAPK